MNRYSLHFEWNEPSDEADFTVCRLAAQTLEAAKVEAALIYAMAPFKGGAPARYEIVRLEGTTVYRYPEDPTLGTWPPIR